MRPFSQIDVFTDELGHGNPVAVVHDADGLTDDQLAAFARWTNLSETTLSPTDERATAGEDPVTGSLHTGVAQWLNPAGLAPTSYVVSQGTVLHRRGRLHVRHRPISRAQHQGHD